MSFLPAMPHGSGQRPPFPANARRRSAIAKKMLPARSFPIEDGQLRVRFMEAQRAVTPGQSIVFYEGDAVLGGAIIN